MFLKRSLPLVPILICLSLFIGCSGDGSSDSDGNGEGAGSPNNTADQVAENTADENQNTSENAQQTVMKPPAGGSLDLTYVTDDFTSAVILHPARLLNSDFTNELVNAGLPLDKVLKEATEEIGVDPRTVDQVLILVSNETALSAPQMLPIPFGPPGGQPGGFDDAPTFDTPSDSGPLEEEKIPDNSDQGAIDNPPAALQSVAFQDQPPADAFPEADPLEEGFGPDPGMAPPSLPSVIVRFSQAVNQDEFFENFEVPLEDVEVDGLQARKTPPPEAVFYFADAKTLIMTPPKYLKKMVDTKSAESDLITELKNIDATHDVIVVADLTPFRQLLQMGGAMVAGQLPPDQAALANIPNKTKMLTLTAGISNASLLSATFVMDTADDAQATNTALTSGLKLAQAMYEQQKAQGLPPGGPLDEAGQKEVIAMADEIIAGLSTAANGNRLTVTIPKPGNFNKLAELMGPIIQEATKEAEKAALGAVNRNNLKQIGIAFHNYYDTYNALPGAGSNAEGNQKGLSWRVHLLPFLDQAPLYEKFNLDEPWDSEHNKALIAEMPDLFKTPQVTEQGKTVYHVVVGENTAFQMEKGRKFNEFTDGLSNTILVVQAGTQKADVWTKPGGLEFDKLDFSLDNSPDLFGEESFWFKILMADGRVIDFEASVPTTDAVKAMLTRNGGEIVDTDF